MVKLTTCAAIFSLSLIACDFGQADEDGFTLETESLAHDSYHSCWSECVEASDANHATTDLLYKMCLAGERQFASTLNSLTSCDEMKKNRTEIADDVFQDCRADCICTLADPCWIGCTTNDTEVCD